MQALVFDWLLLGAIGMALGTVPSLWYWYRESRYRRYYGVLAAVTGITALA